MYNYLCKIGYKEKPLIQGILRLIITLLKVKFVIPHMVIAKNNYFEL